MKRALLTTIMVVAMLLAVASLAAAQEQPTGGAMLQAALGTAFTYQGQLSAGGSPANGPFDFRFILYNDATGGAQVAPVVSKDDVTVTSGMFTVQLDFGAVFDGTALYLEVAVRPGDSSGNYTTLSPRQPITAVPYYGGPLCQDANLGRFPCGCLSSPAEMLDTGAAGVERGGI